MLAIAPELLRQIAVQSPDALGTVLANAAVDRGLMFFGTPSDCFRPGWIASDVSGHPAYAAAFPYDADFTGSGQTIVSRSHPDHGFVVITAKIDGETETECLIVGDGFALRTRDLLRHRWDVADPAEMGSILTVIGG